ncbi:MAG TPA: PfkB family carbohydrate kinase, partial [Tepidisphaeraceae bacterium]|nr:PfkB family carbohydrate kinase [Tepidisphaeraceae bacterium]
MSTRLIELVENLPRSRVVLLGDLMVDRYLYGNAERLSPEAPVPVLHYQREEIRLGGAGGVAADLATLGATVRVIGVVGADDGAKQLRKLLIECGADCGTLVEDSGRPTIAKVRLVGLAQHRHPQQMMRLDFEDPAALAEQTCQNVLENLGKVLGEAEMLCIEDYNKGLLSKDLCQQAIERARRFSVPVFVDPAAIQDYSKYAGATALKLNRTETEKATGLPMTSEPEFAAAGSWLIERLGLEAAVITLDKHGAYLATRDGERRWLKT